MAAHQELFKQHLISIPALGRRFKLGDIYDLNGELGEILRGKDGSSCINLLFSYI